MRIAKRVRVRMGEKRREQIETRRPLLCTKDLQPLLWIGQVQVDPGITRCRQSIRKDVRIHLKLVRDEHESRGHSVRPAIANDLQQVLQRPLPLVFQSR
jgi:hypothetical protein